MTHGLTPDIVREISRLMNEPAWMLDFRLKALEQFFKMPLPRFGPDLSQLNFDEIIYYVKPEAKKTAQWENVPSDVKQTFTRLGIPAAEQKFLAGVGAQYDSEMIYLRLRDGLKSQGVIFLSMEDAVQEQPDLVKQYFGAIVPYDDNKFAALNSACFSGGSFIYVPKGVKVEIPLQAYFRINAKLMGQFERTLIVAEKGSQIHYIEGCSAPLYSSSALHCGVVEIAVKQGARVRYTTIQNWSKNVYNLVTKRARVEKNGFIEWLDFNSGSKLTMKYPSMILAGDGARGEMLSICLAGAGQRQDIGGKAVHLAPKTGSKILSKSIVKNGGSAVYRGLVSVSASAKEAKSFVRCDSLILDEQSLAESYPGLQVQGDKSTVSHEAVVSSIEADQLFYLQTRGLSPTQAKTLIVNGYVEPLMKELPLEYAVELNRLIEVEMGG